MAGSLALASFTATAQDKTELEEVLVSARLEESLPQELAMLGSRVQIIDSAQIERQSFTDVTQVIQMLGPSIAINPRSGAYDYSDVSMQGSRTNEVLWLVDGVRISNRLYNNITTLDTIPAHMIERVEILEGGQGLFYGTQAIAGAVNIITKSFAEKTGGSFSVGGDTNHGRTVRGFVRSKLGNHSFVAYGSTDQSRGYQPFADEDYQPSATDRRRSYDVMNVGVKYGYDFTPAVRFSTAYQRTEGTLDNPLPEDAARRFNERREDIVSAKLDIDVTERVQLFLKGYYHEWDSYYTELNNSLTRPGSLDVIFNNDFWGFKDFGVNALARFSLHSGVDYYVGYDMQNYKGSDNVLHVGDQTERVNALLAQARTNAELSTKGRMSAGVRSSKGKEGSATTIWTVSGQYDLPADLLVRALIGTSFRLPDVFELFGIDPCCEQGNPALRGEKSRNVNASIGGPIPGTDARIRWELVGFHRRLTDLITPVDDGEGMLVYQNSSDTTTVKGGQVSTNFVFGEGFGVDLSYMYTKATTGDSDQQILRIPKENAKGALQYLPQGRPFGGSLTFNYYGDAYIALSGGLGRQRYGGYSVVDLSGFLDLDSEGHHRMTARLQNAFDEEYASSLLRVTPDSDPTTSYAARYLGTPRTFHLSYAYTF